MDGLDETQVVGKRIKSYIRNVRECDRIELEDGTIIVATPYEWLGWFEIEIREGK